MILGIELAAEIIKVAAPIGIGLRLSFLIAKTFMNAAFGKGLELF